MNRTRVLCLTSALVSLLTVNGESQEVLVGGQLGTSFFTFRGEGMDGLDDYRTGLAWGLTFAYPLGRSLRLETGAWWVDKGAEGELQGFEEAISAEQSLSYLRIPVLVRFLAFPDSPVRPSVAAGAAVAFETGCEALMEPGVLGTVVGCDEAGRAGTDLGLIVGAGVAWRLRSVELLIDALYEHGLRDIGSLDAARVHNRGFVVAPRLSIPL